MKITEIRIGNYIRHNIDDDETGKFCEPNEDKITDDDMFAFLSMYEQIEKAEPIPLTEEWLMRFGFFKEVTSIKDNSFAWMLEYNRRMFIFYHPEMMVKCYGHFIDAKIKFVHQLQNLFFALTKEELEIKQP